jgi:glucose-6-phosphate 1-dehydrogenase
MTHEEFRDQLSKDIREFATVPIEDAIWKEFRDRLYFSSLEFDDPAGYARLATQLHEVERSHATGGNILFYLATPPAFFSVVIQKLHGAGLTREDPAVWRRVIIEKPFGHDLDSARALNAEIAPTLREHQIYRIDHYLGKETVQNILVFRFANGIFEPIWNRRYIEHVQISVAECIGVEGRGSYYEGAGALRDMVQNHMFQLLALVAMEPPSSNEANKVRDEKVKVLDAIRPMAPEEVLQSTVRGQYGEGAVDGKRAVGYRAERDVSATSRTETYAALKLTVENWRWAGVPFYLRTGKRLRTRNTEISIQFRRPPLTFFRRSAVDQIAPNRLVLQIQPEEGIKMQIQAKHPGPTINLNQVNLDFSYKDFGDETAATGYERLLYDAMVGDSTLFHRTDMVEAAWRIATPLLDVWASLPPRDFPNYEAGGWGPKAAEELIERDGRRWVNP